jgi:tetratricopeptide (TPR) repeat protein
MNTGQNFQKIAFDLNNSDISPEVFSVIAYYLSPSEMSLFRFLKAMESFSQMTTDDLDREITTCQNLTQVNLSAILWQSIEDAPSKAMAKSATLLAIRLGERTKDNPLKYLAAHCLYANGHYQRASALLARIPGADLNVVFLEGMCHFRLGEFDDALGCFKNALSIDPNDDQSQKFRCLSLIKLNRHSEARPELELIWQKEKSLDLLLALVSTQILASEPKEAIALQFAIAEKICKHYKIVIENGTLSAFIDLALKNKLDYEDILDWLAKLNLNQSHLGVLTTYLSQEASSGITSSGTKLQKLVELSLSAA